MKGLAQLIRLHRWKLDEKRQKVGELELLREAFQQKLRDLESEVAREQKVAGARPEEAITYGGYATAVIDRREKLNASLKELESAMAMLLEEVSEAFREYKKYDLIQTRNERLARKREDRQQQADMDEAGLNVFRRQRHDPL